MPENQMILVINNDPNLLFTLTALLGNAGYRVVGAGSLSDGLNCLEIDSFNLVLLDLEHPFFEEQRLLAEIHQQDPEIPVLLLTRRRDAEALPYHGQPPGSASLLKPVDPALILEKIAAILAAAPRRDKSCQAPDLPAQDLKTDTHRSS